ncbi:MAG: FtsX-like permease family protein [Paracoccaceae bacterium]|nr:FtsX-like permease family protein [Paracoccaceae bacterium]
MEFVVKIAKREIRGGIKGFRIFMICLALGSMALAAISSMKKSIDVGLDEKGIEVLGGDASIKITYRFATEQELDFIKMNSSSFTETTDFRSMAAILKDDTVLDSTLIQVKGIDGNYPLYGKIKLQPDISLTNALDEREGTFGVIVSQSLLTRLDLAIGNKIRIGDNSFEIRAQLIKEPDAGSNTFSFAPKVLAYNSGLINSGLLGLGTMFDTEYKLVSPDIDIERVKQATKKLFKESGMRWRDSQNATPGIDRFVDRLTSFLLLIGMAGMAIGGIGVALSVTVYLETKSVTIATFKTLGAKDSTIFSVYFLIIILLAIGGSTIGALLGAFVPIVLEPFISPRFPIPITFGFYVQPILSAIFYGVLTAILFSLWPLGQMLKNSIANLIRNFTNATRVTPDRIYQILTGMTLLLIVLSFSLRSPKPLISISVFCGIGISLIALVIMARCIKVICAILAGRKIFKKSLKTHLALSSLGGPNNEITLTMLSVGLGLIVLATIGQIDNNLRSNIDNDLTERAPTFFLIDIQDSQLQPLKNLMLDSGYVSEFSTAPMLRGVISHINGIPAKQFVGDHWAIRGDRGLTYSKSIPQNSTIIDGDWWASDYDGDPLISFAHNEASEMGLSLGDKITVNVLGRDLTGTIQNFRDVNFATMRINFLMVFNPHALELAPHSHIGTIYSDQNYEATLLKSISHNYPNVTAISMHDTLSQVSETLATITTISRWSSVITILIGLVVLVGVAIATEKKRTYEACLLKTLGASNTQILTSFALRSLIIGAGAGLMAITVSNLASWGIISGFMNSRFSIDLIDASIIILVGIITNTIAGLFFAQRPLSASISQTLRHKE